MEPDALDMLEKLKHVDIEEPVGFAIESFIEKHPVTDASVPVFERFLRAADLDNRSAALRALAQAGRRCGYEADALMLHFQARDGTGSPEEFAALGYLSDMREAGSSVARRILEALMRDPYVMALFGLA